MPVSQAGREITKRPNGTTQPAPAFFDKTPDGIFHARESSGRGGFEVVSIQRTSKKLRSQGTSEHPPDGPRLEHHDFTEFVAFT